MPKDCHLGELLQQLNSLNVAKPSERTLIRQGKKLPESGHLVRYWVGAGEKHPPNTAKDRGSIPAVVHSSLFRHSYEHNSPIPGHLIGCYYLKLANPQQLPTLATVATTVLANG